MGKGGRGEGRGALGVPQPQGETVAPVQSPGMHPPEGLYVGVLIPCPVWTPREGTGLKQCFPSYLASLFSHPFPSEPDCFCTCLSPLPGKICVF